MKTTRNQKRLRATLAGIVGSLMFFTHGAAAQLSPEAIGRVETLPVPFSPHWMWVSDAIMRRIMLVDLVGDLSHHLLFKLP